MRYIFLTYCLLLFAVAIYPQSTKNWIAFKDENSQLIGFKNSRGQVEIEPKFMGFTMAKKLEHIMAVTEECNGSFNSYYLTKSLKKVGQDSLYIFDNGVDCEREGFIRFKDKKTSKVGMFDKDGQVSVPAIYDDLSKVQNGLIWALIDSEKKYLDDHKESGCDHYVWEGGTELLIDTNNQIIIKNFNPNTRLDFFSMTKDSSVTSDKTRKSFEAVDGKFYSFNAFELHFDDWIRKELLQNLSYSNVLEISQDHLVYWTKSKGWVSIDKQTLLAKNNKIIKDKLLEIKKDGKAYFVTINGLNPFIYDDETYQKYFNNCGQAKIDKYPVLTLIINNKVGTELVQDHFEFLKTDDGYRLIGFTIANGIE